MELCHERRWFADDQVARSFTISKLDRQDVFMGWLDPIECQKARVHLAQGNVIEAANTLLSCKTPDHKAVRQLLVEIQRKLLEEAQSQYQAGALETSCKLVEVAKRCGELPAAFFAFVEELSRAVELQEKRQKWQQAQLSEAKKLADAGQLDTAIQLLEGLAEIPEAEYLRTELTLRREVFQRAVEACWECIRLGDPYGARRQWEKAREIMRDHPQISALAREIARLSRSGGALGVKGSSLPVTQRSGRFILARKALVLLDSEIAIGTPRTPEVKLPLLGRIHSRHAILFRDRAGWQITPCTDKNGDPCLVWINGRRISTPYRLVSGDEIGLGAENFGWSFLLPCQGSLTAVLAANGPTSGTIWVGTGPGLRNVILLADELVIRPQQPAHLVMAGLPCKEVRLVWKDVGLCWEVQGGKAVLELPHNTIAAEEPFVHIPSCLVIQGELSEAESLGRVVAGIGGGESCRIEIGACERITLGDGETLGHSAEG
jgi:hypothetical protein